MKQWSLIALCVLFLAGATSCALVKNYRKTFVFSQEGLQSRLEEEFPIEKKIVVKKQRLLTCVLSNPVISLRKETDQVGLRFDSVCKSPKVGMKEVDFLYGRLKVPGHIFCSGELDYRPKQGKFYVERVKFHNFEMPGLPEDYEKEVRKVLSLAIGAYLNNTPIYSLKDKGWKEDFGRYVLRGVEVRNGTIVAELGLPE